MEQAAGYYLQDENISLDVIVNMLLTSAAISSGVDWATDIMAK